MDSKKLLIFVKQLKYTTMAKQKFILSDNAINGITINERIQQEELFDYQIRHRESFIDELINWISEARSTDKELMKADLKMLMKVKDDYILSSISTNDYLYKGCAEFENTCKELLELNETLSK